MSYAGLGGIAGGLQQGQMNLQTLQQRAQQIQQMQMQLEASKRELAGQYAAAQSLIQGMPAQALPPGNASPGPSPGGQAPMGAPQPPMPGQASVPMGQPVNVPTPRPRPPMPGDAPPTGPQMAPQPQAPQGAPQQPATQNGPGGQDLSPQAQMQILAQIAQGIKAQSPQIDPLTLLEAVKQKLALMTSLSNTQKQQLGFTLEQMRESNRAAMQDQKDADIQNRQNTEDAAKAQRDKANNEARAQVAANRIADADKRLQQTQAAIGARQDKSLQGRATNKAQSERLALLRSKVAKARADLSAANATLDPSKIATAQQGVDTTLQAVIDFQGKVMGGQAPAAAPAAGGGGNDPLGLR